MVHPERNLSDIYVRDENKKQHVEWKDNILNKFYVLQFHIKYDHMTEFHKEQLAKTRDIARMHEKSYKK